MIKIERTLSIGKYHNYVTRLFERKPHDHLVTHTNKPTSFFVPFFFSFLFFVFFLFSLFLFCTYYRYLIILARYHQLRSNIFIILIVPKRIDSKSYICERKKENEKKKRNQNDRKEQSTSFVEERNFTFLSTKTKKQKKRKKETK